MSDHSRQVQLQHPDVPSLRVHVPDSPLLQFFDQQESVASLWVEDGTLRFEGDVDEAAERLLDVLTQMIDDHLQDTFLDDLARLYRQHGKCLLPEDRSTSLEIVPYHDRSLDDVYVASSDS